MRGPKPPEIKLTPMLEKILKKIAHCYTNPYWLVLRAKCILYAAAGGGDTEIAQRLDPTPDTVGQWRACWLNAEPRLLAAETAGLDEKGFIALITATLSDAPHPGAPDTFTPEQLVRVQLDIHRPTADRVNCRGITAVVYYLIENRS